MRITYIRLDNFTGIYVGLNKFKIEYDFTDTNRIILLRGINGSGKSTLLSTLHPFATNGSIDNRPNDYSIILNGKDGYKEIHIEHEENFYVIKHFYTHTKDSHSGKSYIMKNDIELNENGNSTSFRDIIELELGIVPNNMNLLYLGNQANSFVQLTPTQRKQSIKSFLLEVDEYLEINKVVSNKLSTTKGIMKQNTFQLQKMNLSSDDIEGITKKRLEKEIKSLEKEEEILSKKSIEIQSKLRDDIHELKTELKQLNVALSKSIENQSIDDIEDEIIINSKLLKEIESKVKNVEKELTSLQSKSIDLIQAKSSLQDEVLIYSNTKEKIRTKLDELESVEKNIQYLQGLDCELSNEDLLFVNTHIADLDYSYQSITNIESSLLKKVFRSYHKGRNDVINTLKQASIVKSAQTVDEYLMQIYPMVVLGEETDYSVTSWYKSFKDLVKQKISTKQDLDRDILEVILNAFGTLDQMLFIMTKLDPYVSRLPKRLCNYITPVFIKFRKDFSYIFMKDEVSNIITKTLSTKTTLDSTRARKETLLEEIKSLNDYKGSDCETKLNKISQSIEDLTSKIHFVMSSLIELRQSKTTLENTIIELNKQKEIVENRTKKFNRKEELANIIKQQDEYLIAHHSINIDKKVLEAHLKSVESSLIELQSKLTSYEYIEEELKSNEDRSIKLGQVADSTSIKTGIPLYYMSHFLDSVHEQANIFLDIAYDGVFTLDALYVNADEFGIPYIKNLTKVEDIRLASQGERAFASIAISFALLAVNRMKYNVLLFDEIDAALDDYKRKEFANVVDECLNRLNCDQLFIISHNDNFDNDMSITKIEIENID